MNDRPLDGRVAIVTGSARDLGREIALELARKGAGVVITSRADAAAAGTVVDEIVAAGGRASWHLADVTRPNDVAGLVDHAAATLGGLDILVNNAGYRHKAALTDMTFEAWKAALAVMLDGPFFLIQAAAPHMRQGGHGRVINIGGAVAHRGTVDRLHGITSRAGLVGMTRSLAIEMAAYGTANYVAPGRIDGRSAEVEAAARLRPGPESLVPPGPSGRAADVAAMVAFLSSDAAGYITGQTIHVNGGIYLP